METILAGNYSEFVNMMEGVFKRCGLRKTRLDVIAYCVGFFGYVNEPLLDMIYKLYADGIIE